MTCGIYFYWDNHKDELAYIGQSVNCERRFQEHLSRGKSKIHFDKILQNNPSRYSPHILLHCCADSLDEEEILAIKIYKPKFNFHCGGTGFGTGKNNPNYGGLSNQHKKNISKGSIGKVISKEARQNMSKNHADVSGDKNPMYGKTHSQKTKDKISTQQSKKRNTSGYYRVFKKQDKTCKQNFRWIYRYPDSNGNKKELSSVDIDKLEQKIKNKGLKWIKFNKD